MNTIFKYNDNAKNSTNDLKGGYNSNNFSLLNICLDEKGTSVKIQLLNITINVSLNKYKPKLN